MSEARIRSSLASVQFDQMDVEEVKRDGYNQHDIFVVNVNDPRMNWMERQVIVNVGNRLYGKHARESNRG